MLVKNAENYINRLKKIIITRFGNIETAITHDDDCDMHAVQISFILNGKYSWVCAYEDDDVITYYVSGKGYTKEMTIEDTQVKSMYKVLDKVEDLAYEPEATEETEETEETKEVEKVCGDCSHFNACMQGNQTIAPTCCMFDSLYKARKNPGWHHVSLNTLANLDFDMLDEKRQLYLQLYRELKELIKDLHKCKSGRAYEKRIAKMYIRNAELLDENKISHDYINYVTRKVSMCNVECGLWTSKVEEATGFHKSRRYNRHRLKY